MSDLLQSVQSSFYHNVLGFRDAEARLEGREGSYLLWGSNVKSGLFTRSSLINSWGPNMSSESIRMSIEDPPSTIDFYRKLYSYFRVTSAVLESCTLLVIIYSLAIILTALVKYWYQSKNLSISLKGQYCLGLYILFVLTNKLTTIISLFATTQPLKFDSKGEEPQVTLLAAIILFAILTMIRISLVYIYKRFFSAGQNG